VLFVSLELELLDTVTDFLSRGQDSVVWLPGVHESVPAQAGRKCLSRLLALYFVRLEAYKLFKDLESWVLCPVVKLNLFVVVCPLFQPVVRHLTHNWRWLTLVATADGLNTPVFQQVEEALQNGPGTVQISSQMMTRGMYF